MQAERRLTWLSNGARFLGNIWRGHGRVCGGVRTWIVPGYADDAAQHGRLKNSLLYERFGFVVEGCRKMSIISEGEIKDEWMMAL